MIDDRRTGARARAWGSAHFIREDPGSIRWSEQGSLLWGGAEVAVERTLMLRRGDDGRWNVFFEDGSSFHPWRAGLVEHPCADDSYLGRLEGADGDPASEVGSAPRRWTLEWTVLGPSKDYTLTTTYERD